MKPLIIANWKMNPQTLTEAKRLFNLIKRGVKRFKNIEIVICPPFLFLSNIQYLKSNIQLGAQNCFWEEKGPFTGEISPLMLKNLNCEYIIIGHSEREKYLRETDEMANKKIKAVLSAKLKPILCIGEIKKEKKLGRIFQVLKDQLKKDLKNLTPKTYNLKPLIIAYEPVWAIGTGKPCQPKAAKISLLMIRKILSQFFNLSLSKKIKIIYGGSVSSKIAKDYIKEAQFQGLLIGGASLNPKEFIKIVKGVSQA